MIGYLLVRFARLYCMYVFRKLMNLVQDVNAQPEKYAQTHSNM